ncbi:hypothetical protein MPTK1_5g04870 [Marchantia polymorpha subsp. ruderalis]|uniref:Uncharacterized protein n=2 Tax=Marchantia polymorpha TaxID=3197 RepID=A0AAF6BF11_MARPO|nr:hypothetical protein MARPO_0027s0140 [Marchantia polymorpha]BBN10595.1 hypothetical protein Mp_5g04870 [Marchantia polymorpha subsp. ruderalis]|eukprot:PTQ43040.1 hypothetical protein MARPO_0027s0140 [Marchantia polymorpha]
MPGSVQWTLPGIRKFWQEVIVVKRTKEQLQGPICVGGRSSYLVFQLCSYLPLLTRSLNHQLQKGEDTLNACFAPDPSLKNRSYIRISYRVPFG